jgi:hypothetical protein
MTDAPAHIRYWNRHNVRIGAALLAFGLLSNYVLESHSFLKPGLQSPRMYMGGWPNQLLPIVSFYLSAAGLLLVIFGLRERISSRSSLLAGFLVGAVLTGVFALFDISEQIFATGSDTLSECSGIIQAASDSYPIPDSLSQPGHPAAFCAGEQYGMFMSHFNDVSIYGVTARTAQDRMLHDLSAYRGLSHVHPLHVGFYEKENWTGWRNEKNGASGGSRGPENLIRVTTVR